MQRDTIIDWLWFGAVALVSSLACIHAAKTVGVTFDEPTYLECGLNFWHTGSHRQLMKLGTMPLPVDAQTLPLAVMEWSRGERFDPREDCSEIIPWMRTGNLVFWWLLLYSGMSLARDLAGRWAGRLAIFLLACDPNLLAHAGLATTDIAITAACLAFAVSYRRGRSQSWRYRIAWPGIWCGLALLSKASALAFCPITMVGIEISRLPDESIGMRHRIKSFLRDGAGIAALGFAIAFIVCGSDFQPSPWFVNWSHSREPGLLRDAMTWLAEYLCIFRNAGEAIANQIHHNMRGHGQFLLGEADSKPFWYYFGAIFLLKATIPVLIACGFCLLCRYKSLGNNSALMTFALLLVFSVSCRVQLGIRMQFPALAMLTVGLCAELVAHFRTRWLRFSLPIPAMASSLFIAISAYPFGLAYFNGLWGNPNRAYLLATDSNYDWGQGLTELGNWHESRGRPGLDVWYFGQDPALKKMPVRDLPLHCLPLTCPADFPQYLWGRKLAVSTSVHSCWPLTPAHRVALDFLHTRRPVDRTRTFLIYDFGDLAPPVTASAGSN